SGANQYEGSVEDMTGEDSVTVQVGAGDGLAFSPTAVRVDSGTTVTWEWTGEGGSHNVVDEDGKFESELMQEEGATFEYAFEEGGNTRYFCNPHKGSGMKAAVIVE
ncbi:halocyanin domain-containing protein, partial [Halobacteriales archaeon SW_10_66_29]